MWKQISNVIEIDETNSKCDVMYVSEITILGKSRQEGAENVELSEKWNKELKLNAEIVTTKKHASLSNDYYELGIEDELRKRIEDLGHQIGMIGIEVQIRNEIEEGTTPFDLIVLGTILSVHFIK